MRHVDRAMAIEKNTWFHLSNNCCMSILYNLRRINEICKEHVENNFRPLPERYLENYEVLRTRISTLFNDIQELLDSGAEDTVPTLRRHCEEIKNFASDSYHGSYMQLHDGDTASITVLYVYLNLLQETREMVSTIRKYLRAYAKLRNTDFSDRLLPLSYGSSWLM